MSLHLPLLLRPIVSKNLEGREPFLELHLPVEHNRSGHHDQMGPPVIKIARQVPEQRDGLDGFAQTHLIRENA